MEVENNSKNHEVNTAVTLTKATVNSASPITPTFVRKPIPPLHTPATSHHASPTPKASPSTATGKRRGRPPKRARQSDSESSVSSSTASSAASVRIIPPPGSKSGLNKRKIAESPSTVPTRKRNVQTPWTLEDKQKFVNGLGNVESIRKADGNINWSALSRSIGTKSVKEVKDFAMNFNALESGTTYEEFGSKAAVDVWRQLAGNLTWPGDDIDQVCIPQTLTVAALEPVKTSAAMPHQQPNYGNIYNYLSSVTRGTEVPNLPANDAMVVLELLEDLIYWLSKSQTLIQREFMHARYAELRRFLHTNASDETQEADRPFNTSTNPFAIPFDILEFKGSSDLT